MRKADGTVRETGRKLFQYGDGMTEATNIHNELYGMDRLKNKIKDKAPHEILPAVKRDIDEFVGEALQFDDITMLCLEYKVKATITERIAK